MQYETSPNKEQAEIKVLQWLNNSPQEDQKTLRWRSHNVLGIFRVTIKTEGCHP